MPSRNRYLMCSPDYFDVSYVINPWMEGNLHCASPEAARRQWRRLYDFIGEGAEVELIAPRPELPDMPFTANAGIVWDDKVVVSRFLHPERQGEEEFFAEWFAAHGFTVYRMPDHLPFEGAGDALLDEKQKRLWAGWGHRSSPASHDLLAGWIDAEVLSLRLVDNRFYHLDTCFCPLDDNYVLYYPQAFDEDSQQLINRHVPPAKRIPVAEEDALNFACNAVRLSRSIILNRASGDLKRRLEEIGLRVMEIDLSEFLKAGGTAKCLTLNLGQRLREAETVDEANVR